MTLASDAYPRLISKMATLAISAGERILDVYKRDFEVYTKKDDSPLTEADKASHAVIRDALAEFPVTHEKALPVLSEEGQDIPYDIRKSWEYYWLVDPLDGTKEFVNRNGEFTVNIALIHNGLPTAGVIYIPVLKILYFAARSIGSYRIRNTLCLNPMACPPQGIHESGSSGEAYSYEHLAKNAEKLPPVKKRVGKRMIVMGSRSHRSGQFDSFIKNLELQGKEVEVVSKGSALKFCAVAEGTVDLYPRFGPTMEWDTAAGQAICTFAGKRVLTYNTMEVMRYNKESLVNDWFIVSS